MASASCDNTIRLCDPVNGKLIHTITGHTKPVTSVAFSPDGAHIVAGSEDKSISIYKTADGKLLHSWKAHKGPVNVVLYSPNGETVVSGSSDQSIRIWDANTRKPIATGTEESLGAITSLSFSPDGKRLACGSNDSDIRIWDEALRVTVRMEDERIKTTQSVAFSPDGRRLATACSRGIFLWDSTSGEMIQGFFDTAPLLSVAFSPDGAWLAAASMNRVVHVWDIKTGKELCKPLEGHSWIVTSVAFSPDGATILSASFDQSIRTFIYSRRRIQPIETTTGNKISSLKRFVIGV